MCRSFLHIIAPGFTAAARIAQTGRKRKLAPPIPGDRTARGSRGLSLLPCPKSRQPIGGARADRSKSGYAVAGLAVHVGAATRATTERYT